MRSRWLPGAPGRIQVYQRNRLSSSHVAPRHLSRSCGLNADCPSIRYPWPLDPACQAASMQFSQESVVALAAIGGNIVLTWATLRGQRKSLHVDRVWERRTAAYDDYVAVQRATEQARSEAMGAEGWGSAPELPDPAEQSAVISRIELYGSEPVREAVSDWAEADRDWHASYGAWRSYQMRPHRRDTSAAEVATRADELKANAKRDGFRTGVLASAAVDTIRREVLTARPRRLYIRYRMERNLAEVDRSKGRAHVYASPRWLPGWADRIGRLLGVVGRRA